MTTVAAMNPEAPLEKIAGESIVDRVSDQLRAAIVAGHLPAGQPFRVNELARRYGISHIPIREAVRRLESEGLVITRSGRSAIVAPLTIEELNAIYRLRRMIEPELAVNSRKALTSSHIAALEAQLTLLGNPGLSIDEAYEAHHLFHRGILVPGASDWDLRVLDQLWRAAERYRRHFFTGIDPQVDELARRSTSHRGLLDIVIYGSPTEIRKAVRAHLDENEHIATLGITGETDGVEENRST